MKIQNMLLINKSVTEEDLINGCRQGKAIAQKKLYERVAPKMLGVCLRYIGDRQEAEHVMIGSMAKVFDKIDQYKGEGSFEGWIRRILINDCLMYIRKNRSMSLATDINEISTNTPDVGGELLAVEDLMNLVTELPIGYGTVFNLYAIEGYNHAEISDMLGISENTSKSQLSRARKWLQSKLAAMESEPEKNITHGSE